MKTSHPLFAIEHTHDICPAYENVKNGANDLCRTVREHCNNLWLDYWTFADDHFREQFSLNFHQRWFEMYLTVSLIRSRVSVECRKPGPDILATIAGKRVWIEAVCITKGVIGKPDSVPETTLGVAREVPIRQYVMRLRSSMQEKSDKFCKYIDNGIVGSTELTVIAVNGAFLRRDLDECVKRSVYGIGNPVIYIDRSSGRAIGTEREVKAMIPKASGAPVGVQCFTDGSMANVSAILSSGVDAFNLSEQPGSDYVLYPNLTAINRWTSGLLPLGREWTFKETDEGWSGKLV